MGQPWCNFKRPLVQENARVLAALHIRFPEGALARGGPNYHRIIHATDARFDRHSLTYEYAKACANR
jgi:hypothetical protein